jgi:hypothetical protein
LTLAAVDFENATGHTAAFALATLLAVAIDSGNVDLADLNSVLAELGYRLDRCS